MMRRRGCLQISTDLFLAIFRVLDGHQRARLDGVPINPCILGFQPEPTYDALRIVVESPQLDDVPAGGMVPVIYPELHLGPSGGMDEYNELQRTVTLLRRSLADTRQLVNKLIAGFPHDLGEISE